MKVPMSTLFFKKHIAFCVCLFLSSQAFVLKADAVNVNDLIDSDGLVTEIMIEVLGQTGVRIKGHEPKVYWPQMVAELASASCEDVMILIQGKDQKYPNYTWMAPIGVERWNMKMPFEANAQTLFNLILNSNSNGMKGLNMGVETLPKTENTDDVLLLGSTLGDFEQRVNFLNKLTDVTTENKAILKLIPVTQIYILTGKRDFNEPEKKLLTSINTPEALAVLTENRETEGLKWQYARTISPSLAAKEAITIDDANPVGVRATTQSTLIEYFKAIAPTKEIWAQKKVLILSSHIFALYQYLITKRVAYDVGFKGEIDVCASALCESERNNYPDNVKLAMLLDNLSRIFYEICQYKQKTGHYPS